MPTGVSHRLPLKRRDTTRDRYLYTVRAHDDRLSWQFRRRAQDRRHRRSIAKQATIFGLEAMHALIKPVLPDLSYLCDRLFPRRPRLLPHWIGDSNFVSVVGETLFLPEELATTYQRLRLNYKKSDAFLRVFTVIIVTGDKRQLALKMYRFIEGLTSAVCRGVVL